MFVVIVAIPGPTDPQAHAARAGNSCTVIKPLSDGNSTLVSHPTIMSLGHRGQPSSYRSPRSTGTNVWKHQTISMSMSTLTVLCGLILMSCPGCTTQRIWISQSGGGGKCSKPGLVVWMLTSQVSTSWLACRVTGGRSKRRSTASTVRM